MGPGERTHCSQPTGAPPCPPLVPLWDHVLCVRGICETAAVWLSVCLPTGWVCAGSSVCVGERERGEEVKLRGASRGPRRWVTPKALGSKARA